MSRTCVSFVLAAACLVALAEGLPSAPAPQPRREATVARGWERLRGTWKVTRFEFRGQPDKDVVGCEVVIGRGTFRLWGSYPPMACRVEPGQRPKRIDASGGPTEEYPGPLTLRGIYKLEGEVLTVCFSTQGLPRPDEFRTDDDLTAMILVLKRVGRDRE